MVLKPTKAKEFLPILILLILLWEIDILLDILEFVSPPGHF